MTRDVERLTSRECFFGDVAARSGYVALMRDVFDLDIESRDRLCGRAPSCRPFALFDENLCVASVEVFTLPLVTDGIRHDVIALRSVAVAQAWRGRGLFGILMRRALAWCDATSQGPVLLYTEEPSLYERFGFQPMRQHKFVGPPPPTGVARPAQRLSLESDLTIIKRLLAARSPVSQHIAIVGGAALFLERVADNADVVLDYLPDADALVVSEAGEGPFTLVDLVAAIPPPLARILAALARDPVTVTVLFPPDRLAWLGDPTGEDAGLMVRGARPRAFDRPFCLPPTAEF